MFGKRSVLFEPLGFKVRVDASWLFLAFAGDLDTHCDKDGCFLRAAWVRDV